MKTWVLVCGLAAALFAGSVAATSVAAEQIRANGICVTPLEGYDYGMDRSAVGNVQLRATRIGSEEANGFDLSSQSRQGLEDWDLVLGDKAYLDAAYQPRGVIVPLSPDSVGSHIAIPQNPASKYFIIAIWETDPAEARRLLDSITFCD